MLQMHDDLSDQDLNIAGIGRLLRQSFFISTRCTEHTRCTVQ